MGVKLLVDSMHGDLAKWLRVVGHDAAYASPILSDGQVLEIAEKENRKIITSDRRFPRSDRVITLPSPHLKEAMIHVCHLFPPSPKEFFTRCVKCNLELRTLSSFPKTTLPDKVKNFYKGEFKYCEGCKRFFWRGSHLLRMIRTLRSWGIARIPDSYVLDCWESPPLNSV